MNPGLRVENVGEIGLPLATRDALEIVKSSYQAPFGTNGKNTVDVSIRNTWEIRADDVTITNPVWTKFLASVMSRACTGLGVYPAGKEIQAKLHKLLLYEKGAMFKPPQE
jgi:hypothetical protein